MTREDTEDKNEDTRKTTGLLYVSGSHASQRSIQQRKTKRYAKKRAFRRDAERDSREKDGTPRLSVLCSDTAFSPTPSSLSADLYTRTDKRPSRAARVYDLRVVGREMERYRKRAFLCLSFSD